MSLDQLSLDSDKSELSFCYLCDWKIVSNINFFNLWRGSAVLQVRRQLNHVQLDITQINVGKLNAKHAQRDDFVHNNRKERMKENWMFIIDIIFFK